MIYDPKWMSGPDYWDDEETPKDAMKRRRANMRAIAWLTFQLAGISALVAWAVWGWHNIITLGACQ